MARNANPKKIKFFVFNKREYKIYWKKIPNVKSKGKKPVKVFGITDIQEKFDPEEELEMTINPEQSEREMLNTLIHEAVHCLKPKWIEPIVINFADHLADFLWECGLRFKKK